MMEVVSNYSWCTNQSFIEYDAQANTSSPGLCLTPAILGCTDVNAFNYDADANQDDGSCEDILVGCTDSLFLEFDVTANTQSFDGEGNNVYCVTPVVYGCTSLDSLEYWDYDTANFSIIIITLIPFQMLMMVHVQNLLFLDVLIQTI